MNLKLPKVPKLKDMKKFMVNRDEKIINDIIKPKDEIIEELHKNNIILQEKISKKANVIDVAEILDMSYDYLRRVESQNDDVKTYSLKLFIKFSILYNKKIDDFLKEEN